MDKHSSQTVLLLLSSKDPSLSSLQRQAGGQCGDVWWGGPLLLQGRAQLGTIDRSRLLECTHGPVSLSEGQPKWCSHYCTWTQADTHKYILKPTVTQTYTPPTTTQTDTQTHGNIQADTHKHTQQHIKSCIASQRHTSTHRDTYKHTYKQTHKHRDTQTTHGFIIPRPSEHDSDQGPKRVQIGLCSWERAAPTAL